MTRRVSLLAVVLLVCVGVAGCQTGSIQWPWQKPTPMVDMSGSAVPPPSSMPGLAPSSESPFREVPIPMNVNLDTERTYTYTSGSLQLGRLVYNSRASMDELGEFYLREAPAGGWKADQVQQTENLKINFSKPGKLMTVTVYDRGIARGRQLVIEYVPAAG